MFRRVNGQFFVVDAGSLNGTYVNRQRVDQATLKNGDEITDTESAVDIESLISKYVFGKV